MRTAVGPKITKASEKPQTIEDPCIVSQPRDEVDSQSVQSGKRYLNNLSARVSKREDGQAEMSEHIRKLNQDILKQKMLQQENDRSVSRISMQQTETKNQSSFDMPLAITNSALAPHTARSTNRDLQARTSPKHDQKLPLAKDGHAHQRGNSLRVRRSPIKNDLRFTS